MNNPYATAEKMPQKSFAELGLESTLLLTLEEEGCQEPTPIQAQAISHSRQLETAPNQWYRTSESG